MDEADDQTTPRGVRHHLRWMPWARMKRIREGSYSLLPREDETLAETGERRTKWL
jgi:hypothetical protein